MENEKTFVLIKPDGVSRGLVGKIISRFEDSGLKIVAMKMLQADKDLAENHYFLEEKWALGVFGKTKESYEREGKNFPYKNHMELGKKIQKWNMEFLTEGPVLAFVLEGPHVIELVRKIVGATEPRQAAPGTIRGDLASVESYAVADDKKRVLRNLVHASDSKKNAEREIALWFSKEELQDYKNVHEILIQKNGK